MPEKLNIKDWDSDDRPRERAMKHGIRSLSTAELLAILIGSGSPDENAVDLMKRILSECHQRLSELSRRSILDLCSYKGIGPAKALTIAAACELGRRRKEEAEEREERPKITSSRDIYNYVYSFLCDLPVEECWAIWLNQAGRVIDRMRVGRGGMTATVVDVRCLLREALLQQATAFILVHNHPSGSVHPGPEDDRLTRRLKEAAALMEIRMLDHIVFTDNAFYSYADEGRL
ncbi:MAG: RadC family protein [Bacteroidaceae bacterium]|jgi:DNA repair protein RadC